MPIIIAAEIIGGLILCIASFFAITSLNHIATQGMLGPGEEVMIGGAYLVMLGGVVLLGNGIWKIVEIYLKKRNPDQPADPIAPINLGSVEVLPWEDTTKKNQGANIGHTQPQMHFAPPPANSGNFRETQIAQARAAIYARNFNEASQIVNVLISQGYNDAEVIELQNYIFKQTNQMQ